MQTLQTHIYWHDYSLPFSTQGRDSISWMVLKFLAWPYHFMRILRHYSSTSTCKVLKTLKRVFSLRQYTVLVISSVKKMQANPAKLESGFCDFSLPCVNWSLKHRKARWWRNNNNCTLLCSWSLGKSGFSTLKHLGMPNFHWMKNFCLAQVRASPYYTSSLTYMSRYWFLILRIYRAAVHPVIICRL